MGVAILSDIDAYFSLVNIVGLSFVILFSLEIVCSKLDYVRLPIDNSITGSKRWILNLFSKLSVGIY